MRFWDTSAIVPLLLLEPQSENMRALLQRDTSIVASFITPVEVTSSIWRRLHHNLLGVQERANAEMTFADLSGNWFAVDQTERIIESALDILTRYSLRAADALQLASAIVSLQVAEQEPDSLPFVTLDGDLASAARAEGFPVLP